MLKPNTVCFECGRKVDFVQIFDYKNEGYREGKEYVCTPCYRNLDEIRCQVEMMEPYKE
jgi:predicted Fe-S protein YdhL (DUF1289 family)